MQQLANALGSAVVTTIYFKQVTQGGVHAVTVSVVVVSAVIAICLGMVWLLPKRAADEGHYIRLTSTLSARSDRVGAFPSLAMLL